MGLIEAVFGKLFERQKDFLGLLRLDIIGRLSTRDEDVALLLHFLADLLAHRAAEHIGAAKGVASDHAGGFHDLFLVDEDAIGFLGDLLKERVGVLDVVGVLLALNVVRDELHRSWTIERNECDDFVDGRDVKLPAERLHTAGFELEDADRLGVVE